MKGSAVYLLALCKGMLCNTCSFFKASSFAKPSSCIANKIYVKIPQGTECMFQPKLHKTHECLKSIVHFCPRQGTSSMKRTHMYRLVKNDIKRGSFNICWGDEIGFVRVKLCPPPVHWVKLIRSSVLCLQCSELQLKKATAHEL